LLASMHYPVKFSWNISQSKINRFSLSTDNKVLSLNANGNLMIGKESENISLILNQGIENSIPKEFVLFQNFPNPFNPSTSIQYALPARSRVVLKIYNLLGEVVAPLVDEVQDKGYHTVSWQPEVASGIYFYRLDVTALDNLSVVQSSIKHLLFIK